MSTAQKHLRTIKSVLWSLRPVSRTGSPQDESLIHSQPHWITSGRISHSQSTALGHLRTNISFTVNRTGSPQDESLIHSQPHWVTVLHTSQSTATPPPKKKKKKKKKRGFTGTISQYLHFTYLQLKHAGTKPRTPQHRWPRGERLRKRKRWMIFLEWTREGRRQSNELRHYFNSNVGENSERWGGSA